MIPFLCVGFIFFGRAPDAIAIRDHFQEAEVVFEDITRDGVNDVWLMTDAGTLWVHDGTNPDQDATRIVTPPDHFPLWPQKRDGVWFVLGFADGLFFESQGEENWHLTWDMGPDYFIRPGMPPIHRGQETIIPTYQGYLISRDACKFHPWPIEPSITVTRQWMDFTYPVPRWRDVNSDGLMDMITSPSVSDWQNKIVIHFALRTSDGWKQTKTSSHFPPGYHVKTHVWGDLNGDGFPDLAVLAGPKKDFSLFEELTFLVYLGNGPLNLDPHPHQILQTKQNLWQAGPLAIHGPQLTLFYYKGLIRSKFRMDRYDWEESGFLNPKPTSTTWKMEQAMRSVIKVKHDLSGDRIPDLLLADQRGLCIIPGTKKPSGFIDFDPEKLRVAWAEQSDEVNIGLTIASNTAGFDISTRSLGVGRWRGGPGTILEPGCNDQPARLWRFEEDIHGTWWLRKIPLPFP